MESVKDFDFTMLAPNVSIGFKKPTAIGAGRSAGAVHAASRAMFQLSLET